MFAVAAQVRFSQYYRDRLSFVSLILSVTGFWGDKMALLLELQKKPFSPKVILIGFIVIIVCKLIRGIVIFHNRQCRYVFQVGQIDI